MVLTGLGPGCGETGRDDRQGRLSEESGEWTGNECNGTAFHSPPIRQLKLELGQASGGADRRTRRGPNATIHVTIVTGIVACRAGSDILTRARSFKRLRRA